MRMRLVCQYAHAHSTSNAQTHKMDCMELKDRIRLLRGKESQASFGDRFGVNQTTVSRWEKGAEPSKEELLELARLAGASVEEFLAGDGDIPETLPSRPSKPSPSPTTRIPEVDVRGGMGGGGVASLEINHTDEWGNQVVCDDVRGSWDMPVDYVRHELRVVPSRVQIIEVRGDSMEPVLHSRDRVMIDLDDTDPGQGGVFAIWDGMSVLVKRIERIHKSDPPAVRVISDNPNHSPFDLVLDDGGGRIIGRAVWFGRRM